MRTLRLKKIKLASGFTAVKSKSEFQLRKSVSKVHALNYYTKLPPRKIRAEGTLGIEIQHSKRQNSIPNLITENVNRVL